MHKLNYNKNFKSKKIIKKIYEFGKKIICSRLVFASIFLIIGSLITYSCQQCQNCKPHKTNSHSRIFNDFNDDFFTEFDEVMYGAFKHHRKMMRQAFEKNNKILENSKSSKIQASLQHFEDEKSHNFELKFAGIKPEEINVLIEKNYLIFSSKKAEIVSVKNEIQSTQSSSSADFYYATNLPEYDEKISPEIIKTNEKISVKLFKKIIKKVENSSPKTKNKSHFK